MIARRRTRKIITRAIVFIIAGPMVNVAVAWGFVWRAWPPRGDVIDESARALLNIAGKPPPSHVDEGWVACFGWAPRPTDFWNTYSIGVFEHARSGYLHREYAEYARSRPQVLTTGPGPQHMHIADVVYAGWPLLALHGASWSNYREPPFKVSLFGRFPQDRQPRSLVNAIAVNRPYRELFGPRVVKQVYPLAPLWPGFAINTIFYAAILWLLFATPGLVRKRRRIKRGLCPACAYPTGSSNVCTECGAAVKTTTPFSPGPAEDRCRAK